MLWSFFIITLSLYFSISILFWRELQHNTVIIMIIVRQLLLYFLVLAFISWIGCYSELIRCCFITDRNECEEWGYCDQMCTNTDGSYTCSCFSGYELLDKSHCAAPNSSSLLIYFAHDRSIIRMDAHGSNQILVANTTAASGLDFNFQKNLLYWTDTKTRKVQHLHSINRLHSISTWNIKFTLCLVTVGCSIS